MTKNKKRVLIASAAVIVAALSLSVGITLSYLGKTTDKKNTIKVGYGDVEISERFSEPSEMSMINPDIQKEIYVQNKSTVPAFVRVYAEFSDSKIADQAKVKFTKKDNTEWSGTWAAFKTLMNYTTNTGDNAVSDWVYVATDAQHQELEGYFYYTKALDAKTERLDNEGSVVRDDQNNIVYDIASTPKLFDSVTIDYNKYNTENPPAPVDSNIDRIVPVEMIVYSELVQTIETGSTIVTNDGQTSTVYGYDYGENDEWKEAWESFLK